MATLLITGGAGFIGSNLVQHALDHTADRLVVVDKLTYAGSLLNLEQPLKDPRVSFVRADIADRAVMTRVFAEERPDAVLNLAAETHVDRSIDSPRAFVDTNIVGTFVLLETARHFVATLAPARARGVSLPARVDRRGVRHARGERPVQRRDAVRAQLAVRGEQGVGRPSRAGLLSHLRRCRSSSPTVRTTTGRISFRKS